METATNDRTDLTPPTIARMLGVKAGKVNNWITSGELEAWDASIRPGIGKPRWRVTREALEAFRRRRSNTRPAPRAKRRTIPQIEQYV